MKFTAEIDIMPHDEVPDPQGQTVVRTLDRLRIEGIEKVRIGKHINLILEAASEEEARKKVEAACQRLLTNSAVETYSFFVHEEEEAGIVAEEIPGRDEEE